MITEYQKVIHKSRYARYLDSEGAENRGKKRSIVTATTWNGF